MFVEYLRWPGMAREGMTRDEQKNLKDISAESLPDDETTPYSPYRLSQFNHEN